MVSVPAMKTGVARIVPMPATVGDVLRQYIKRFRGASQSDRVFMRHAKMAGTPVSTHCVRMAMRRGYRRCEFPQPGAGRMFCDGLSQPVYMRTGRIYVRSAISLATKT